VNNDKILFHPFELYVNLPSKNTNTENMNYIDKINKLRKEKNAIILAHYYQIPEIQDIADFIGDSLGLAQKAAETDAEMIVFAGVHFMAETAKILNPHKKVLLPDLEAGCSLAASCPPKDFTKFMAKHPDHIVLSYINCTAGIKELSDVIVTSGNAVEIVESFDKDQKIIFAPDKNLGGYINNLTGRNMVLWDGVCEVHDILNTEAIIKLKIENPDAELVAHPECDGPVLALADMVGSTSAMLKHTKNSQAQKFIVASETGILHQMQKDSPAKEFLVVPKDETCNCNDCPYMKLNTMEKLYNCLKNETPEISLAADVMQRAKKPIIKMLDISRELGLI
jgi:quinolinate synthase